jgi:hypothetical protein
VLLFSTSHSSLPPLVLRLWTISTNKALNLNNLLMQSPYEMANNSTLYQEQNLTIDDGPSSILHTPPNILTTNHIHHSILQHYHHHYSQSPHNTQQQQNQGWKEQCHQEYQHFYQSHQYNDPLKFQPQQQQTHSLSNNIVNRYVDCEESTATVSFWYSHFLS